MSGDVDDLVGRETIERQLAVGDRGWAERVVEIEWNTEVAEQLAVSRHRREDAAREFVEDVAVTDAQFTGTPQRVDRTLTVEGGKERSDTITGLGGLFETQ